MLLYAIYAITKYVAYSFWSYLGVRLVEPGRATPGRAMGLGAIRWLLGVGFGIVVFILVMFVVGALEPSDVPRTYFLFYTPVRAIEWGIMAALIDRRPERDYKTMALWCVGGIVVSFLSDLVSPDSLTGRFCLGRCLC